MPGLSNYDVSPYEDARDTRTTVLVAFSGFTVLVWDHLVTFDDEVELVWKRDKGLLVYLFLINRYLTPLGFIVNLVAFTLPSWGKFHFVRYEGAMTVIGTQIAGFIMFLRVRALYNGKKWVVWSIALLFLIWLAVNAYLLANGQAVLHYSDVHSCTMIFNPSMSSIATASAWLPLLFDTCILALTLYKTKCRSGHIVRTLFSDGILYYSLICLVNIVLTIMIVQAGPGVKNIAAQLELLLTVAMVSRITLNLKKQASRDTIYAIPDDCCQTTSKRRRTLRSGSFGSLRLPWSMELQQTNTSSSARGNLVTFRSDPENLRLSTICSINVRVSGESIRFSRPGVEGDVEDA